MVASLEQMGLPRRTVTGRDVLNSYFVVTVGAAREVADDRWPDIGAFAGLDESDLLGMDDEDKTTPMESLSRLNEAFDQVFGADAPARLGAWGALIVERLLQRTSGIGSELRTLRLMPGQQRKVGVALRVFASMMDGVRGEPTHAWKQVDKSQFWLVHYQNMFALGRTKQEKACHVWLGGLEYLLRWAGLAGGWRAEEIECGCVTGTFDCVFALRSGKT
jgi:hypothetical protein